MAILYITECESLAIPGEGGNMQIAHMPPVAEQTLAIGGSSASSSAFNTSTRFVRVETDAICAIAFGSAPTAAAAVGTGTASGTLRMNANTVEYFGVSPGHKIAVIATT